MNQVSDHVKENSPRYSNLGEKEKGVWGETYLMSFRYQPHYKKRTCEILLTHI
jgi:hypothetical protein